MMNRRARSVFVTASLVLVAAATAATAAIAGACGGDDDAAGGDLPDGSTTDAPNGNDGSNTSDGNLPGDSSTSDGGKAAEICSADGWCWSNPLPQGNDLRAVFSLDATNAWGAGMDGTIVHLDGAKWSGFASPTTKEIKTIWGASATDLWAGGESGTLLRFDGAKWTSVTSPVSGTIYGLWGSGPNDIWLADNGQTLRRWDGMQWKPKAFEFTFSTHAIFGTSASDVWAVGQGAGSAYGIAHFDGMNWTSSYAGDAGGFNSLNAVWASSATEAWAVGSAGAILHFKDGAWSPSTSNTTANLTGVWGTSATDVWASSLEGVLHWNGSDWSPATSSLTPLGGVHGSSAGDVWAVGEGGAILHGAANVWSSSVPGVTNMHFRHVFGVAPNDVWTVGSVGGVTPGSTIFHWDGAAWTNSPAPQTDYGTGIWGAATNDIWIGGQPNALRWNGTTWSTFDAGQGTNGQFGLRGIYGLGANDIYAMQSSIRRWDGGGFSDMPGGFINGGGNDIWASSPSNVFAVGEDGDIAYWDGGTWGHTKITSNVSVRMFSVSGTGPTDVWASSTKGMYHWDGNQWSPVPCPALMSVHAIAPNDAYAVDYNGKIAHWDGANWNAQASGTSNALMSVWASATDVWVVGEYGTVLRKRRQ